jgi:predicted O-methyltransferase YrrM
LWAWRQLGARVIGVSLEEGPYRGVEKGPLNDHGCEILNGDSHDPDTRVALVGMLKGEPIDILFIDGDHTFAGVKSDFEMFSDLVRPGGIIALHDICDHPKNPSVKVKAFWDSVEWGHYREEIITGDRTWGGIGVFRVPTGAEVAA